MEKKVDATGLVCPAPVLRTREILLADSPSTIEVLVDNPAARENVSRFLSSQGYKVEERTTGKNFVVIGLQDQESAVTTSSEASSFNSLENQRKILVLIMTDRMGRDDDSLGSKLLVNYIKTLKEMGPELWQLIFVNSGVKLACDNSPVLDEIRQYEASGTTVLSCGTCMEHFGLTERKAVGGLTNMLDIVMATQNADKVITLN